jgi:hypothetical protein
MSQQDTDGIEKREINACVIKHASTKLKLLISLDIALKLDTSFGEISGKH